jgi:hypothetical protein
MAGPQVGQVIIHTPSLEEVIDSQRHGPIKLDECTTWSWSEFLVAKGLSKLVRLCSGSEISYEILVVKLMSFTQIREEYIRQTLPKILRYPLTPQGNIIGLTFK